MQERVTDQTTEKYDILCGQVWVGIRQTVRKMQAGAVMERSIDMSALEAGLCRKG